MIRARFNNQNTLNQIVEIKKEYIINLAKSLITEDSILTENDLIQIGFLSLIEYLKNNEYKDYQTRAFKTCLNRYLKNEMVKALHQSLFTKIETISKEKIDLEEEIITKITNEDFYEKLKTILTKEEYYIIVNLYLVKESISYSELANDLKMDIKEIQNMQKKALKKLRDFYLDIKRPTNQTSSGYKERDYNIIIKKANAEVEFKKSIYELFLKKYGYTISKEVLKIIIDYNFTYKEVDPENIINWIENDINIYFKNVKYCTTHKYI